MAILSTHIVVMASGHEAAEALAALRAEEKEAAGPAEGRHRVEILKVDSGGSNSGYNGHISGAISNSWDELEEYNSWSSIMKHPNFAWYII